ncbi:MAG: hypothetical protein R3F48_12100 [Candidatus Zixiibacteriota bacterium]
MSHKAIIYTRPFQALLRAADDLLTSAYPYHKYIHKDKSFKIKDGELVNAAPRDIWQCEKSLCIGSFFANYAGVEAFINYIYLKYSKRTIDTIPEEFFNSIETRVIKLIRRKNFFDWNLENRAYFVIPLVKEQPIKPSGIFDIGSDQWKRFKEVIEIRHSFIHPTQSETKIEITKVNDKLSMVNDSSPDNFWPLLNVARDHRILDYQATIAIRDTMLWILEKIASSIPEYIDPKILNQEDVKIL